MMSHESPYLRLSYAESCRLFPEPYQRTLVALVAVLLAVLPIVAGNYTLHLVNLCFLAVIGTIGLNLLTGTCGQVSLGQASFLAIGAFTTAVCVHRFHAPFYLAIPAACIAGGLVGVVVGLPALRFRGIYLAITTLALHYAIIFALTTYQSAFGAAASAGIEVAAPSIGTFAIEGEHAWYYVLLLATCGVVVVGLNLSRSFIGRAWVAIRDRDIAAAANGISLTSFKLLAFTVSAVLAALSGSLAAYFTGVVTVEGYTLELAILYLAMIIVGGMGSVLGSVLGATFMTLLPTLIDRFAVMLPDAWRFGTLIYGFQEGAVGLVIIAFLLFEPKGLAEIYRRVALYFERWPFRYRELQPNGKGR